MASQTENTEVKHYLTANEVAEKLGVPRATVYTWVRQKKLPALRLGGKIRVHPENLNKLVSNIP